GATRADLATGRHRSRDVPLPPLDESRFAERARFDTFRPVDLIPGCGRPRDRRHSAQLPDCPVAGMMLGAACAPFACFAALQLFLTSNSKELLRGELIRVSTLSPVEWRLHREANATWYQRWIRPMV